jgi:hypothetical protein
MKKKYVKPQILSEKFQPQTYVAACYNIYCSSPNDNWCTQIYLDVNNDGRYSEGDTQIITPPYAGARFRGCGGYHKAKGEARPSYNAKLEYVAGKDENGESILASTNCFYWFGDIIDPTESGDMADFHFTYDLALIEDHPNPNAS